MLFRSYNKVLLMEAENPYAIIGLGHLHYDFREYKEALFYWEKMLESSRDNVDIRVLTSIGNCHRKLKTFENGLFFFESALKREAQNFYALFGLADCYRGMRQQSTALDYWKRILAQDPKNKVILTRAGDAYRNLGELELAVECYERALNIEFDSHATLGLAMVSKIKGKYEEAIESLKRLIQQDSKNYRLYLELSDCHLQKGSKREAIETLEEFQSLGVKNALINEQLEKLKS